MKRLKADDDHLKLIEEYNRHHLAKRFFLALIQFALFVYRVDAFAIYKRSSRSREKVASFYHSEPLRIPLTNIDRWRERWSLFADILIAYYCTKCSAIILVQVHTSGHANKLSPSSSWIGLISHLLGNPLINYTGMTIFLYSVYLACLGYALLYLPHHYRRRPIDSVNIRFWLEPAREFRRVSLSIQEELRKLSQPPRRWCHCSSRQWPRHSMVGSQYALIVSRKSQVQAIEFLNNGQHQLRPITYTLDWYRAFDRFTLCLGTTIALLILVSIYCIAQYLSGVSEQLADYSIFQTFTLIETTCGLLLVIPTLLMLILMFLVDCYSQLSLLNDTRNHLLVCLGHLRAASANKDLHHLASICSLLKPLIRVSLSLKELRSNARTLTEMVSVNLVISGTICVCILLAEHLDGHDLRWLRAIIICGLWCWANLTLLGCAYVFICATKLEKITWSLLAELRLRESNKNWLIFEFQLAEHWRRFIVNRNFSDLRLAVRPFGAALNYDRALQLNFLALSFAVLLKTF